MTRKHEAVTEPKDCPRLGVVLIRVRGQVGDQASPLPGTQWQEAAGGGCELVLGDMALYVRYLNGAPPPGQHLHHRRQP